MKTYASKKTQMLLRLALFMALVAIQTWVPFLGNINIPPLSITFVHVTVIVATLWLGTKAGLVVGGFWGINSWIRSVVMPISPLQQLVLSSPIISVIPRLLMPLIIGLLFHGLKVETQNKKWVQVLFGALGAILNTVILLGFIGLFKADAGMGAMGAETNAALWMILMGIVTVNGIPEMIFSGLVTPPLLMALKHSRRRIGK
ncbi:TPA: ECF transporter S component [Streptococcus suis]